MSVDPSALLPGGTSQAERASQAGAASQGPWPGVIRRYREFLPVTDATPIITLNEQ